jgi:nitroreductase
MEARECIASRRSVRSYIDADVLDEEILDILEFARFAPSWANTQCVRYAVVRDSETRNALADTMSANNPGTAAVRSAPAVVAFLAKSGLAGHKKGKPVDDLSWLMFDAGAAVQTFCLAAHDKGFGTVIVGYFDHKKAASVLGLPPDMEVVAFTPIGYPAAKPTAPSRKEAAELLWRRPGQDR